MSQAMLQCYQMQATDFYPRAFYSNHYSAFIRNNETLLTSCRHVKELWVQILVSQQETKGKIRKLWLAERNIYISHIFGCFIPASTRTMNPVTSEKAKERDRCTV